MVRFEKDKLVIEYTAGCNAVEEWIGLYDELTFALTSLTPEQLPKEGLWRMVTLLAEMMPDYETARKMLND